MSQVEETPIMFQAKYRVKTLMKEVLTRFGKNEAFLRKSILWKDLQKLHDLLPEVRSYIGDCGRRNQIKLIEEIEEKLHLAADFVEEVPFTAIDGAKNELGRETDAPMFGVRKKLSRPPSSSSQTPETKSPGEKLEEINSSLKNLIDQISKEYKLEKGVIHGSDLSSEPQFELKKPRCSTQEEVEMIGRSEELKQLINVLLEPAKNEEAPLQIIPIMGQEGIGKTTLAWAAYDHKQIKDHFDLRVWVSASVSIEAKWVSEKILEAVAPNWRAELDSVDEILAVLLEELGGKSFFLVLDDVTGTEATLPRLKLLKDCLLRLNTTRRNKIVITTSSNEVAKEMDMHSQFHLQKLSDDHCKVIFQKEVSGGILVKDIEKLVILAGGIPLAAKVLGSINDSKAVVESGINYLLQDDLITIQEEDRPTFGALNLSYLHLPPDEQLCFAYMSMFPPNTPIEKGNVIQLWIAHGFFPPEVEDMGESCYNSLLNSCLIEPAERDSYGYISSLRLARIAWELASLKLAGSTENHVSDYSGLQLVQASESAKLHTFFSVGNNIDSYDSYDFGSLKVLNLSRSQFKKWPVAFDKLIHLRYLDVSGTKVAELPESISKLIYIQTIRAINCSYLERLPKDLSNLEELRHFCIDADNEAIRKGNMPLGLGTLTCLQTLPLLVVSQNPHISVEVLGPLNNLRGKLTVCNLEHLTLKEAEGGKLMEKDRIDELQFEWSMNKSPQGHNDTEELQPEDVLEKLQPNANLKSLTLQNFAGNEITMWKSHQAGADTALILKNLMMLKLSNCYKCKKLPTLGTLPCLTELHIEGMDNLEDIGPEFYTTGTAGADESKSKLFPALRKFTLMYLAKLKSWSKAEGGDNEVFPLLEDLRVEGCDELVSTPSHFQSLKRLHVESVNSGEPLANICSNIASLTSVHISSVLNLQSLPEGILRNNPNLSSLLIWNCPDLTQIPKPDTWSCSNSLRSLSINECEKLENLPENLNNASSLTELIISQCNSLKSIPSVDGLCSLRRLKFEWCSGLESLPSGLRSCTSLEHLTIKGCPSLTSVQDEGLTNLTSLCSVNILGCEKLTALPLRELLHYLIKLRRMEIEGFTEGPLGLTIEYPGLTGWARFKALPKPFQTQKIKGAWTIDPKLIETFATKAVGFLEAMQLFETGVKTITR
ncbi:unnamed protein product [Rhodiola kirilowii]